MINNSIWQKGIKFPKKNILKEDITVDVLIVGAGITGITTAYNLKDSNLKIAVIDQGRIISGTTLNTTGKLTFMQDNIYKNIETAHGKKACDLYLKSQIDAIEMVKNNIIDNNIKCNFESTSSYLYTNKENNVKTIKDMRNILKRNNIPFKERDTLPIKSESVYSLKVDNTFVFHPVKYLLELKNACESKNINFYENTRVIDFKKENKKYVVKCDKCNITTKKLIIACHYPFFIKPYLFPLKTYMEKSFVTCGTIDKNKKFNAINVDSEIEAIRYFTDNKDYLIYTSEVNKLGKNMDNCQKFDNAFWNMKRKFTDNIKYYWFNYDIMTFDSLPIVGYIEKENSDLLMATGYNTWGMTNATIASKVICDLILNKYNEYADLFDPLRKISLASVLGIANCNLTTSKSLVVSKLVKNFSFYPENVSVYTKDDVNYGKYTDEEGVDHIVYNTCPHMKCSLMFNDVDKSWDCPCHGSRFDVDGNVIKGPSVYSIKINKKDK